MFHKCGEYNLSANKQTTVTANYRRMSLIQLESSRRIPYFVDVLLLITMYIFFIVLLLQVTIVFLHIYIDTALRRVVLVLIRLPGLGSLAPSLASVLKMANRMNHNQVESVVCYMYSVYTMCAI